MGPSRTPAYQSRLRLLWRAPQRFPGPTPLLPSHLSSMRVVPHPPHRLHLYDKAPERAPSCTRFHSSHFLVPAHLPFSLSSQVGPYGHRTKRRLPSGIRVLRTRFCMLQAPAFPHLPLAWTLQEPPSSRPHRPSPQRRGAQRGPTPRSAVETRRP